MMLKPTFFKSAKFLALLLAVITVFTFLNTGKARAAVTYNYQVKDNKLVIIEDISGESCVNVCGKTEFKYVPDTKYKFEGSSFFGSTILVDGNKPEKGIFESNKSKISIGNVESFKGFFPDSEHDDNIDTTRPKCFIAIDGDVDGIEEDVDPAPCSEFPGNLENGKCYLQHRDGEVKEVPCNDPLETGKIGTSAPAQAECQGGNFGWIFCGIIEAVKGVVNFVKDFMVGYLKSTPLTKTGDRSNQDLFNAWKNMRNLANVFLIPVFFMIIFSQALSLNIDAYTVKKMLPRLVAAAILIQLSYYLVAILVDITNVLGNGAGDLLTATFTHGNESIAINPGSVGTFLGVFALIGSVFAIANIVAAISLIATLSIPLLIAVIGILVTLIFRQLMIVVLAIAAPLAFAAWILPNTERIFKLWWSTLIKILMMYPLIVLLLSAGTITAGLITSGVTDSSAKFAGAISDIMALIAVIVPLAAIPFTFKFAGGALGAIAGQVDRFGKMATRDSQGKPRPWFQRRREKELEKYRAKRRAGGGIINPTGKLADKMEGWDKMPGWVNKVPGIKGIRESRAKDLTALNMKAAEHEKEIDGMKLKPETMRDFARFGWDDTAKGIKAFDDRRRELYATGDADKATIADQLGTLRHRIGEQPFTIAMSKQAMAAGQDTQDAREIIQSAYDHTKSNQALASGLVGALGYGAKAVNPEHIFTRVDKDGKLKWAEDQIDSETGLSGVEKAWNSLGLIKASQIATVRDWDMHGPALERLIKYQFSINDPRGQEAIGAMRQALLSPDLSPDKRAGISKVLSNLKDELGDRIPGAAEQAMPVRIVNDEDK